MPEGKTSRYEYIRVISARALQISQGAPPLVKTPKNILPLDIAKLEWEKGLIPIQAKRRA